MAIKTSELTKMIAEQVTKDVARKLIPKFRKIVREEVDRGMKDLLYEMVIGKPAPDKVMEYAQGIGMILLLGLLIFANGNDILKLF